MKKNKFLTQLAGMVSSFALLFTLLSTCGVWVLREARMPESMLEDEE
ncbi:hypothetical protein SAMN05660297_01032 [Natronincola peptidivorans]|uniref:Uncharacterized protein n=1 Tax=Natronincola peptidivorans TaxID=426128 RepID=A0A1I0APY4_9FIRM|nr:hypothetical protein [Natronincola peptidivorans]SES96476.1 hypothetical protein SAMN05660297_01032 [Natronincola peptidivorans]